MNMKIKDLDQNRELTDEEKAAVTGGDNLSAINAPTAAVAGGFAFASPTVAVGSTNTVTQLDNDVKVDLDTNTITNNLVGSLANIGQKVK
ncbi:MAG: hypothetical protein KIT60_30645 [Burkholderiaceae bacterium]|jgi:hypothetical protein|nr:hypothetical protein [Burkholderiaceae bacterium]